MEIGATQSKQLQSQEVSSNAAKVAGAGSAGRGQELPSAGGVMPAVEVKAAPKVPEFKMKDLAKAMDDLQSYVDKLGRDLAFGMDPQLDRTIITVRDTNTHQLVRQIPSEEVVSIARQIQESLDEIRAGLLMDDRA